MCRCDPTIRTPCCKRDSCHAAAGILAEDCPWCTARPYKVSPDGKIVTVEHEGGTMSGHFQGLKPSLPELCPKCGYHANWRGPTYHYFDMGYADRKQRQEWLEWRCTRCGYDMRTPTLDAKEKA